MSTVAGVLRETFPVRSGEPIPYLAFPEAGRDAADAYATPPMRGALVRALRLPDRRR